MIYGVSYEQAVARVDKARQRREACGAVQANVE